MIQVFATFSALIVQLMSAFIALFWSMKDATAGSRG
tara:strand:- start:356 stop:463 length:108 start_codon:yes stop_codon:yes gene_type:complete